MTIARQRARGVGAGTGPSLPARGARPGGRASKPLRHSVRAPRRLGRRGSLLGSIPGARELALFRPGTRGRLGNARAARVSAASTKLGVLGISERVAECLDGRRVVDSPADRPRRTPAPSPGTARARGKTGSSGRVRPPVVRLDMPRKAPAFAAPASGGGCPASCRRARPRLRQASRRRRQARVGRSRPPVGTA